MMYTPKVYWFESMIITDKDSQTELKWRMKNLYWTISDVESTFLDLCDGLEESLEEAPPFFQPKSEIYDSFSKTNSGKGYQT